LLSTLLGGVVAAAPAPKITGPLPVIADSYPLGAADHERIPEDLKSVGYAEEEYLISGTANVYDWPAPGPAVVRTTGAPYTTRILIRRPASRAHFSGTVAVEMANPSNLFDLNLAWTLNRKQFIRNGDAFVLITSKPVSVVTLKRSIRCATRRSPGPIPCGSTMREIARR
jgi:hypothetical protein